MIYNYRQISALNYVHQQTITRNCSKIDLSVVTHAYNRYIIGTSRHVTNTNSTADRTT